MAVNFNEIPSGVNLSAENIDGLSTRSAEAAAAFARKLEKLQKTFDDARQGYARDAEAVVASADSQTRAVAKQFAKRQEAQRITKLRRSKHRNKRSMRHKTKRARWITRAHWPKRQRNCVRSRKSVAKLASIEQLDQIKKAASSGLFYFYLW